MREVRKIKGGPRSPVRQASGDVQWTWDMDLESSPLLIGSWERVDSV